MKEERGPNINIKNINFINKVENYIRPNTVQEKFGMSPIRNGQIFSEESKNIFEQDYFKKHIYMLKDKLLEMFKNSDKIPMKDKRLMEKEFHLEIQHLKNTLKELKVTRKSLITENNERHLEIDRLNEDITVFFSNILSKKER